MARIDPSAGLTPEDQLALLRASLAAEPAARETETSEPVSLLTPQPGGVDQSEAPVDTGTAAGKPSSETPAFTMPDLKPDPEAAVLWLSDKEKQSEPADDLLNKLWGYEYDGDSRTVDSHIKRLRAKLDEYPHENWIIDTFWGVGYKFADVTDKDGSNGKPGKADKSGKVNKSDKPDKSGRSGRPGAKA